LGGGASGHTHGGNVTVRQGGSGVVIIRYTI
jgi:hypothetical protein